MTSPAFRLLSLSCLAAAAALLSACAPVQPELLRVGRAQVELPPGEWTPLASDTVVFDVLPDDVSHDLPMHARLLGLRNARGELLASVLVQTNATNHPRDPATLWTWRCLPQQGVQVEDATQGSSVRIDCLRYKRRADLAHYLPTSRPQLASMLAAHQALPSGPYAHIAYRYSTAEGGFIAIDVLADQRLLRPPTRNNMEFLRAGRPAQEWMHQLRDAARVSVAMMDGRLVLPPFPQPLPQ